VNQDFILREKGIVVIRENHPFIGRVTIYYTPPEGFVARAMELPERAFLEELNRFADRRAARAARRKTVEQPDVAPPSSAAPLQKRVIKPPVAAEA